MYILKTEQTFDSAHFLKGYDGKCKNLHGHTWRVIVEVKGEKLVSQGEKKGMVMDFSDLKSALKDICDYLDHSLIYEVGTLKTLTLQALKEEEFKLVEVPFRPTAENLAEFIYKKLSEKGMNVARVEVYETPANCAAYEE